MNKCADLLVHWSEARLRNLLSTLADSSQGNGLTSIATAQAGWERFREAQCGWEKDQYDGGSMAPMVYALCLANVTERRLDELKGFLCGPGGGTCAAAGKYDLKEESH